MRSRILKSQRNHIGHGHQDLNGERVTTSVPQASAELTVEVLLKAKAKLEQNSVQIVDHYEAGAVAYGRLERMLFGLPAWEVKGLKEPVIPKLFGKIITKNPKIDPTLLLGINAKGEIINMARIHY